MLAFLGQLILRISKSADKQLCSILELLFWNGMAALLKALLFHEARNVRTFTFRHLAGYVIERIPIEIWPKFLYLCSILLCLRFPFIIDCHLVCCVRFRFRNDHFHVTPMRFHRIVQQYIQMSQRLCSYAYVCSEGWNSSRPHLPNKKLNLQTRIVIQLRDSVHIVSSEHISFFACRFDKAHLLRRSSEISDENIYIHRPEIWVKPIENFRLAIQELGPRTHNHEIWKPAMAVQHTEELFEGICLFWALQRF